jgi:heme A synthase
VRLLASSGLETALVPIHQRLGYALLGVLGVGLLIALLAIRDHRLLPTTRAYLWLAVAAVALQGILGITLVIAGARPGDGLHFIYGPLTLVTLPLTLLFCRGAGPRREAWTLAAGFLIALLLAFRAIQTG